MRFNLLAIYSVMTTKQQKAAVLPEKILVPEPLRHSIIQPDTSVVSWDISKTLRRFWFFSILFTDLSIWLPSKLPSKQNYYKRADKNGMGKLVLGQNRAS